MSIGINSLPAIKPAVKAFDRIGVLDLIYSSKLGLGKVDPESGVFRFDREFPETYYDKEANEYLMVRRKYGLVQYIRLSFDEKRNREYKYYVDSQRITKKEFNLLLAR